MPTTYYQTLDASGSNSTTLNDAPSKNLTATVTATPVLVRSPIRKLAASAGGTVSILRVATKTFTCAATGIATVTNLVDKIFDVIAEGIASFIERHWGARPFAIVNSQNNWVYSDVGGWYTVSDENWSYTVLGD
jgi:hypothetical protein